MDITEAHPVIARSRDLYAKEHAEVDKNFHKIREHAVRLAEKLERSSSKPRVAQRQQHRSNAPAESVVKHCKMNCAIPFLDHILSSMDKQLSFSSCHSYILTRMLTSERHLICTLKTFHHQS